MGWVTLTARKQSLRLSISSYEMRDIEISRETRRSHRNYSYDQSIMKNNNNQFNRTELSDQTNKQRKNKE